MWGEKNYTLEDRIEEIEKAVKFEMWQSALALSLTVPDICGQIEFKNIIDKNGKRLVGKQYKEWFKKYIDPYFLKSNKHKDDIKTYFTAEMCWQLRNAFLHSGTDNTEENIKKGLYSFKLKINSVNSYSINEDNEITSITLDIKTLCDFICKGARKFINQWENKNDLIEKRCTWVDVKQFSEYIHKYNK